jgi:hypothetical protein
MRQPPRQNQYHSLRQRFLPLRFDRRQPQLQYRQKNQRQRLLTGLLHSLRQFHSMRRSQHLLLLLHHLQHLFLPKNQHQRQLPRQHHLPHPFQPKLQPQA